MNLSSRAKTTFFNATFFKSVTTLSTDSFHYSGLISSYLKGLFRISKVGSFRANLIAVVLSLLTLSDNEYIIMLRTNNICR